MRPRVLVCHPALYPAGGGNAVAAWTLEALREEFDVGLATLNAVNLDAVNRAFGTSLASGDFQLYLAPARYSAAVRSLPTSGALLEMSLTVRWALEIDRRHSYGLLFSTSNEAGFARPGIQYVHYPWAYLPRPEVEYRWFHHIPGLLGAYRKTCLLLARGTWDGLRRNLTLTNSEFTAGRIRQHHGIDSVVVYPPVPGEFPEVPWPERRLAVAGVGRLHPGKCWDKAVAIVEAVRRRGHDLELTVFGHDDSPEYVRRLELLAADRPWFRLERECTRQELAAALSNYRYGIHCMLEEHFGIGPAELQRAGCIVFVHNSGGTPEIVGRDPSQTYETIEEAADKLTLAITDAELERRLLAQTAARRDWFSAGRYCSDIVRLVRQKIRES